MHVWSYWPNAPTERRHSVAQILHACDLAVLVERDGCSLVLLLDDDMAGLRALPMRLLVPSESVLPESYRKSFVVGDGDFLNPHALIMSEAYDTRVP